MVELTYKLELYRNLLDSVGPKFLRTLTMYAWPAISRVGAFCAFDN